MPRFPAPGGNNSSVFIGWLDASMLGPNPGPEFKIVSMSEPGTTSVSGLGEAAYYSASPQETAVSVLYHGEILKVGAVGSKNPGIKAAIIAVAKQFWASCDGSGAQDHAPHLL